MKSNGTYVYCLVAARRKPSLRGTPRGLPSAGPVRLVDASPVDPQGTRQWLVVADVPLDRFGEAAINRRLHDLDWVARAAVAHESVVESFIKAAALVPMRLFTIFKSDDRALEHFARHRQHMKALLKRVARHDEWGIRVVLDRAQAVAPRPIQPQSARTSGAGYLAGKKQLRDRTAALAARSRDVVAELYDELAGRASLARRRGARELPVQGGPLLLDAAFLVSRSRSRRFRTILRGRASRLAGDGYHVSLTGPWPAYSFLE